MTSFLSVSQSVVFNIVLAGVIKPILIESSIGTLSQSGPVICEEVGATSLDVMGCIFLLLSVLNLEPKSENI